MDTLTAFLIGGASVAALGLARDRLAGFSAQRPSDYGGEPFDLRRYLNGVIDCDGVIFGPTGRVVSRFSGDFKAAWQGNHGTMREHYRYSSGATQDREWRLVMRNADRFEATAADVIGTGQGVVVGGAVQMRYRLRLAEDAGAHVLRVVDWMYLTPDGTIVNCSEFRKFGVVVARLSATMRSRDDRPTDHA
ncbi:MAG: DUF3833 family protein [Pseudooceanicola sp.]|nr:DUF3833 family protein [Pseudooceanicola sp.]